MNFRMRTELFGEWTCIPRECKCGENGCPTMMARQSYFLDAAFVAEMEGC